MQRKREFKTLKEITLAVQGNETYYFQKENVLTYSLKGDDLTVVLLGGYELPAAKDAEEVERFLNEMNKTR